MRNTYRFLHHIGLITAAVALAACTSTAKSGDAASESTDDAALMARGVNLLYQSSDPVGAEAVFREVMQRTPTHYGARFQLAVALDRGGRPADARVVWDAVLQGAQAINDTSTGRIARVRLAAPDTASQDAMMVNGIDLLRRQNNPTAAAAEFRKVLQRTPTHYGATYQLAVALDKAGQPAQARPLWQKVVGMATSYNDEPTARLARERLAARP